MKKGLLFVFVLAIFFASFSSAQISSCQLSVSLLNQDPYPAIPGEYVKVVFQLEGLDEPSCGKVAFAIEESFPFTLEPGQLKEREFSSGTFVRDYSSYGNIPYKLIVDKESIDGDIPLRVKYAKNVERSNATYVIKEFNINVKETRTDFEVHVKDYDSTTQIITFEILNVGEHDAEALTIEIPKQESIVVKGSNRNIVGSLDSNEDTSFNFEAMPKEGLINMNIYYNDEIGERRTKSESVSFDPEYFSDRLKDQKKSYTGYYIVGALIVVLIILWFRARARKKAREKNKLRA